MDNGERQTAAMAFPVLIEAMQQDSKTKEKSFGKEVIF
jgi:hypothetical protein